MQDADYVFHLASLADIVPSIENPIDYFQSNVTSTLIFWQVQIQGHCLSLYAASSSCYGIAKSFQTNENEDMVPEYPYALTKNG